MFERFSHIMLFATDLARALAWYQEKLGFKVNFAQPPYYASLRHEGAKVRLDLHPSEAGAKDVGFGPMPFFAVKDVDATLKELAAKGVKVGQAKREGDSPKFATFWDCEGNALGIEEIRKA
ncbi:MAG: VOC family protein [Planctomycetes bacterium]|nr:VOC family protein [Planctomycetota bacterium]